MPNELMPDVPSAVLSRKRITAREWKERAKLINSRLKKDVAVVHIEGNMTLLERKIYNVLLLNAYDELGVVQVHSMPTWILCDILGYNSQNTQHLQMSLTNLMTTTLQFNLLRDGKREWKASSLLAHAAIAGGVCSYSFSPVMAEWLRTPEVYASINLGVTNEFRSGYALALYENCLRFLGTGSTGELDLDLFRMLVGAHTEPLYKDFYQLRKRIIDASVAEINACSDILIKPSYKKKGRQVVAVSFSVKKNAQGKLYQAQRQESDELLQRLRGYGVPASIAQLYASSYRERAELAIEHLEQEIAANPHRIRNPAGYLRALIDNGIDLRRPHPEVDRDAKELARKRREAKEQSDREGARQKIVNARISAALQQLSNEQVLDLFAQYRRDKNKADLALDADGLPLDRIERMIFKAWMRAAIQVELPTEEEVESELRRGLA